jgi:hypothetical protein
MLDTDIVSVTDGIKPGQGFVRATGDAQMNRPLDERGWIRVVGQTRSYGSCYIPAATRSTCGEWETLLRRYSWRSYGRSLQAGGHKHKAYCHDKATGKPIPTKEL